MKLLFCLLAAAISLSAQPKVGLVEIYGARKVSSERIRKELAVKPGDGLPRSKADSEARLETIPGVVLAQLEAVCCEDHQAILYVGIEERGSPAPRFHPEPDAEINLPEPIAAVYSAFTEALGEAVRAGDTSEDISRGHSLMQHEGARTQQLVMATLAGPHLPELRKVLRESMFADQRAVAAYVLQYVPEKGDVVPDLQYALQDSDDAVRRNAIRALTAIAILGRTDPSLRIRVQSTWLVELLNSVSLNDRLEATRALLSFTDQPDPNTIANLKQRALPALFEMAQWRHLANALPAYLLLGRVAGWKDDAAQEAWTAGDRDKTVDQWRKLLKDADKPAPVKIRPDPPPMSPFPPGTQPPGRPPQN
jgi:hypothetical protein